MCFKYLSHFPKLYLFKIGSLEGGAGISEIVSRRGLLRLVKEIAKKEKCLTLETDEICWGAI